METVDTSVADINEAIVHTYNLELRRFADHGCVFTALEGMVTTGHITKCPDAAIFKHQLKDLQVDVTSRMAMPLKLSASYGDSATRETTGEETRFKTRRAFANSTWKVVDQKDIKRTFGGHAKGKAMFDLASVLLKDHLAYTVDDFYHQAPLDGCSINLTSSASSGPSLTQSVSKNIYVPGTTNPSLRLPAYNYVTATHTTNLINSLINVDPALAAPVVDMLTRLQNIAFQKWRLRAIGGIYSGTIVVLLHPDTATQLKLLQSAGSLKALQRTTFNESIAAKGWTVDLGMLGRLQLIEDPRCPLAVVDGINSTPTFSHIYRGVGETDPRLSYYNDSSNTDRKVFHANIILGMGGIDHAEAIAPMYDDQIRDMNTLVQLGYSFIGGMKRGKWDETPTSAQDSTTAVEDASGVMYTYAINP